MSQITLCDPIWHVSSRSGAVLIAQTAIRFYLFYSPCCVAVIAGAYDGR